VWRLDRFARSTKHLLSALEEFRSLGVQFISYQENMDTSTSLGQALFTIVSAVAQLERDLIRERVTAGIRNARGNGKKLGRPTSSVDRDRIIEMKSQGRSLRQIAACHGVGYGTVRSNALDTAEFGRRTNEKPRLKTAQLGREDMTVGLVSQNPVSG
jgi:DNA invertase Pin-like site-specific DNA recombinase